MRTADEIVTAIISYDFDEGEVTRLWQVVRQADKRSRARKLLRAQAELKIGATVTVSNLRPARFNGVEGRVQSFNAARTRADVLVEKPGAAYDKKKGDVVRGIPMTCLTQK